MAGHSRPKDGVASACVCPAMTSFWRTTSRRDDFLPLLAEAFDAQRNHVADIEEFRGRLHAGCDAGWRSRGDDVTGQQRQELRDIRGALSLGEDHGRGRPGLAPLAVDV